MNKLFKFVLATASAVLFGAALAQAQDVQWSYKVNDLGKNTYEVVFNAEIEDTWHMYDLGPYDMMGPNPTVITFENVEGATLEGTPVEVSEPIVTYDDIFAMEIG